MPTLSFKDRGAVTLVAAAKALGVTRCIADSSGNAGTAISAYCARAGIACDVYVKEGTSAKKLAQMNAHGASVHIIPGSREDAADAAIAAVEKSGAFYASHIYNPFFYQGTKSYFYEVYEQLHCKMPDAFVIPVGNGTLLLGGYIAFKEMLKWKLIDKMPRIIAIQAQNCAPIARAFKGCYLGEMDPTLNFPTLAEGIAIAKPARIKEIVKAIRETNGCVIEVEEGEISAARANFANRGMYVEITTAANFAGYHRFINDFPDFERRTIVLPLCGAGIKSEA